MIVNRYLDGPLLQHASTVISVPRINQTVALDTFISPELPRFFGNSTVALNSVYDDPYYWSPAFNETFPTGTGGRASNSLFSILGYNNITSRLAALVNANQPVSGAVHGCPVTCMAKLRAPAFTVAGCVSQMLPIDYENITYGGTGNASSRSNRSPPLWQELFIIASSIVRDEIESLNLITGYPMYSKPSGTCTGFLNLTACTYNSAIGEYDVHISGQEVTFLNPGDPTIVALANNTKVDSEVRSDGHERSTLAGIVELITEQYATTLTGFRSPTGTLEGIANGIVPWEFQTYTHPNCPTYTDPGPVLYTFANKLMIWSGS